MLTGENIICFAKEWSEDPTSNNHVMRLLAERNKVLWLNSIATRTPKLGSKDDVAKIKRKLRTLGQGAREVAPPEVRRRLVAIRGDGQSKVRN